MRISQFWDRQYKITPSKVYSTIYEAETWEYSLQITYSGMPNKIYELQVQIFYYSHLKIFLLLILMFKIL